MTKYKTYDKIYFIAPNPNELFEDIEKLDELFLNHRSMIYEITTYNMPNKFRTNTNTTFISIELKTTDLSESFFKIAKKIDQALEKDFKIFMKTANDAKYTYTPDEMKDKLIEVLNESINNFVLDD